ncbi:MAG TPA: TetR/AcrR family transcriptional regulator [Methylibium sp.]|nr:TetR/AcrR family transcriptional regulator [Methylibium sp.]
MPARSPKKKTITRLTPDLRMSEIIATTRKLIQEKGYEGVLTTEVASRCGISEATIFKYFPTKRDLLRTVTEQWFGEVLDQIEGTDNQALPVTARLRQVIWESLSIIRHERALSRYILMELRADPTYKSMRIYQLNRRYTSRVISVLKDAVRAGEFRPDISLAVSRNMIFGSIEHQTWAYLRGEGDFDVDEAADQIAGVISRGLMVDPKAGARAARPAAKKVGRPAVAKKTVKKA